MGSTYILVMAGLAGGKTIYTGNGGPSWWEDHIYRSWRASPGGSPYIPVIAGPCCGKNKKTGKGGACWGGNQINLGLGDFAAGSTYIAGNVGAYLWKEQNIRV